MTETIEKNLIEYMLLLWRCQGPEKIRQINCVCCDVKVMHFMLFMLLKFNAGYAIEGGVSAPLASAPTEHLEAESRRFLSQIRLQIG